MDEDTLAPRQRAQPRTVPGAGRHTLTLAAVALGYVLLGLLTTRLAVPPSGASAIMLPSGLALAAVALLGVRAALAAGIGHFTLLLLVGGSVGRLDPALLILSLAGSVGAALASGAGGVLLRRRLGTGVLLLDDDRSVLTFLGIVAVVAAIAPTLGTMTVALAGTSFSSISPMSWPTWWVAECTGMAIVAPIAFIFFARPRAIWWRRRLTLGIPLVTATIAVTVAFLAASRSDLSQRGLELNGEGANVAASLSRSVHGYLHLLSSVERLFAASSYVSRDEFRAFVDGMSAKYPGIAAVCWAPVVSDTDRARFEREQSHGADRFQITDWTGSGFVRAGRRESYVPVVYVESLHVGVGSDLGFDIASSPERVAPFLRARDRGAAAVTKRITLVNNDVPVDGVLLCQPIYAGGSAPPTVDERRAQITGFVVGVLPIDQAVGMSIGAGFPDGHRLEIVDHEGARISAFPPEPPGQPRLRAGPGPSDAPGGAITHRRPLEVPGVNWTIKLSRIEPPHGRGGIGSGPWKTHALGLAFVSMLGGLLLVITGRTSKIERVVLARTHQLVAANRALHAATEDRETAEAALHERNALFRAMVEDVQDYAIFALDPDGRIKTWNKGAEAAFGYAATEITDQAFSRLYTSDDLGKGLPQRALERAREDGHDEEDGWRLRSDGTPFWGTTVVTAIRDAEGLRGFSAVIRDVTDRRRVEADLRRRTMEIELVNALMRDTKVALEKSVSELERSNQELDDFAYIASHDLKEPLRGIHNYANFLIEDYGSKIDAEGQRKLDTLARLAQRMEDLINSLLYFSRVGRLDLALEETDLNEVVDDVVDSLSISLEEKAVELRRVGALPTLTCDSVRVREIYRNLITNALKYNDKSEKWIEVGFGPVESADGASTVDAFFVRDNGIGIREKHKDAVFRIFKRLHGRDRFGGGTGAGLTIVKKIVERHGGEIWIVSEHGEGTTFCFTLERSRDASETTRGLEAA